MVREAQRKGGQDKKGAPKSGSLAGMKAEVAAIDKSNAEAMQALERATAALAAATAPSVATAPSTNPSEPTPQMMGPEQAIHTAETPEQHKIYLENLKEKIRKNPNDADTHFDLAYEFQKIGENAKAVSEYKEVIRINPNENGAYNNMGLSLEMLGNLDEAIAAYKKTIELKPDHNTAKASLARATLSLENKTTTDIETARSAYYEMLKAPSPKVNDPALLDYATELRVKEEAYKAAKKKIIEGMLAKGPLGKSEAQDFILKEVEFKRKDDLENKRGSWSERMVALASKGIKAWDDLGNKKGAQAGGIRLLKTGVSLVAIGAISGLTVQGAAKMGLGTASALGGGMTSYLVKRLGMASTIATIMAAVPAEKRKWLQGTLIAGAAATALATGGGIAVGGLVASSAIGLGLSHLTKKYNKKIEASMEKVREGTIDIATLDRDISKMEEEMETALKQAESRRLKGKLIEGAVAITGSIGALEIMGAVHDHMPQQPATNPNNNAHQQAPGNTNPAPANGPGTPGTNAAAAPAAPTSAVNTPATPGTVAPAAPAVSIGSTVATPHVEIKPDDMAIVHKGEGVEHAFIRQIENNPKLAQDLGFEGDITDKAALHAFAGREAHVLASETGYVDNKGHEIRVMEADKVAYEIKIENGEPVVVEKTVSGNILDTHSKGDAFGSNPNNHYEKSVDVSKHVGTQTEASTGSVSPEILAALKKAGFTGNAENPSEVAAFYAKGNLIPDLSINPMTHEETLAFLNEIKGEHAFDASIASPQELRMHEEDMIRAYMQKFHVSWHEAATKMGHPDYSHGEAIRHTIEARYPKIEWRGVHTTDSLNVAASGEAVVHQYANPSQETIDHWNRQHLGASVNHYRGGFSHENTIYGYTGSNIDRFSDITEFDKNFLHEHENSVIGNPFGLHGPQLVDAVRVHENNIHNIFPVDTGKEWAQVKDLKVNELINNIKNNTLDSVNPKYEGILPHLVNLYNTTLLSPEKGLFWLRGETIEHWAIRATQAAASMGKWALDGVVAPKK